MLTRRLILSVLAGSAFKGINFASGGIVKNSKPYVIGEHVCSMPVSLYGRSPIEKARDAIALAMKRQEFGMVYYTNCKKGKD